MTQPWEREWAPAQQAAPSFDDALKAEGVTGQLADIARSIYQQESGSGRNTKTSNAGAVGGMQVIPSTFASVADEGWDISNPEHNARAGIRYVRQMHELAGGDPALTAAGYYGGPGGLAKARRGVAVSDPRNPNAPTTLQYGQQVAARLPAQRSPIMQGIEAMTNAVIPSAQAAQAPQDVPPWERNWDTPTAPGGAQAPAAEEPSLLSSLGRQLGLTARAGIRGVAALPAMASDAITGPINAGLDAVRGEGNGFRFQKAGHALDNVMAAAGLPTPQNATERVVQDAAGGMAGAGGMVAAGGALSRAAGKITQSVGSIMGAGPGLQVASGAAGAGASSVTRENGGSEAAQVIAGLAGGLAPSALPYAGQAAVRGALRGGEAGRQRVAENVELFERATGSTPTLGQATEGRWQRGAESLLGRAPGGAGVIAKAGERQAERMADAVRQLSDDLAPGANAMTAGESIAKGVAGFKAGMQQVQTKLYNELDKHIPGLSPIPAGRTQQALNDLNADIAGAPALSKWFKNARIQGIDAAMKSDIAQAQVPGALPYEAIKKLRTLVGRELADGTLMSDVPRSKWSALYAALSDDLGDAATAAGPAAAERWNWANVYTKSQLTRLEELQSIVGRDAPEKVFSAAISGTSEGNTIVQRVFSALPKQNRREVAAAVLQRLGRATAGNQNADADAFSAETFLSNLSKLSPAARKTVFGRLGVDGLEQRISAFAKIAESRREGGRVFANPSGTAAAAAQLTAAGGLVGALASGNPAAIATAVAIPIGAFGAAKKIFTNPAMVRGLAEKTMLRDGSAPAALSAIGRTGQTSPPVDAEVMSLPPGVEPWQLDWTDSPAAPEHQAPATQEAAPMPNPEPEAPAAAPAAPATPAAEITQDLEPVELQAPEEAVPVAAQGAEPELQPLQAVELEQQREVVPVAAAEPEPEPSQTPRESGRARALAARGVEEGDLMNSKGMPFTVKLPAMRAAAAAGEGYEVVPVERGYVVRHTERGTARA